MNRSMVVLALAGLTFTGCTDSGRASFGGVSTSTSADVTCYSGGQVIYKSFGKAVGRSGPGGWYVQEASTGKFVRVSGDCVLHF